MDHPPTLIIRNGRVLDPASGRDETGDVLLQAGRVAAIGARLDTPADALEIDAEACLVTPGLIDPHVHLREPGQEHKETIESGTRAGVAGGFTTLCCMPNTNPAIDTPHTVRDVLERVCATAHTRVFPVGAATIGRRGQTLTDIAGMRAAGAVAFSDDGDVVEDAGVMRDVLAAVRDTGACFMQHCQEPTLTRGATMNEGDVQRRLGEVGWARAAEEIIIERDIRLNRAIGCRYHVQHVSSGDSVEIVRRARDAGEPVTVEASPHHLILTDEACAEQGAMAKMNPPLRERRDVEALRAGVADGAITVLATDHAPHSDEEKSAPFASAPFGIIGLETALPLYAEALVETGAIDWTRLIRLMTVEPAALCGLDGLGRLEPGGVADVTVIDPAASWTVSREDLVGRSANTPFLGRAVRSRAIATIVAGRVRFARPR